MNWQIVVIGIFREYGYILIMLGCDHLIKQKY